MLNSQDTIKYFTEKHKELQEKQEASALVKIREKGIADFAQLGIPTVRNEEWKYTRISGLFNKDFEFALDNDSVSFNEKEFEQFRLPQHENANEIVFINGIYSTILSNIRSSAKQLTVVALEEAARGEYKEIVETHLGHSNNYLKNGIHALNTAFAHEGVFIHVKKGQVLDHPVYIYNISDSRSSHSFSQSRNLIFVSESAEVKFVETFATIGSLESFTNEVTEIVVEQNATVSFYKIQNETAQASQVSTTHVRQIGKSLTHIVTVSLGGGIVRNNLNIVLDAEYSESHLNGLYLLKGNSLIDNHTVVDNVKPNCYSNELYKGIVDENASGVFNGKIFVRPLAQKTNAYQSNKNVLLSENASVNTKPQLEIFADDVKCSHGCAVGKLDEEALFYLRSRGIGEKKAQSLLLHGFAAYVVENIKLSSVREYVDKLISERLEFE